MARHEDLVEEVEADADALDVGRADLAREDLVSEGPEDDEAELNVDVHEPRPVADEAFGCGQEIVHANAEADLLDHLVGVLGVDVVLDGFGAGLGEVLGRDLD